MRYWRDYLIDHERTELLKCKLTGEALWQRHLLAGKIDILTNRKLNILSFPIGLLGHQLVGSFQVSIYFTLEIMTYLHFLSHSINFIVTKVRENMVNRQQWLTSKHYLEW